MHLVLWDWLPWEASWCVATGESMRWAGCAVLQARSCPGVRAPMPCSGGMKRRLSVAIALVGDPLVVYLDEPSTVGAGALHARDGWHTHQPPAPRQGLDPASRRLLWDAIRAAARGRALVLTTHSMEEAEALFDRLGIFLGARGAGAHSAVERVRVTHRSPGATRTGGHLACVGDPKDLTGRFGTYLSLTITTPAHQEAAAAAVVRSIAPGARLVHALGGTQRFEVPRDEADVATVFSRMEQAKLRCAGCGVVIVSGVCVRVQRTPLSCRTAGPLDPAAGSKELELIDWGVSHATLEEVFVKLSTTAQHTS